MTINPLPDAAVVRVSRGNFAPARFAEVREMTIATGRYLIPAISRLPGRRLKEMIAGARNDAEAAEVTFIPIVNYPTTTKRQTCWRGRCWPTSTGDRPITRCSIAASSLASSARWPSCRATTRHTSETAPSFRFDRCPSLTTGHVGMTEGWDS